MSSTAIRSQAYKVHLFDTTRSVHSPSLLKNLSLVTVPIPKPNPGSVVIRVRAISLNFRDLLVLSNTYAIPTANDIIPCLDAAGEIHSAGPGSKWQDKIGTKVIVALSKDWIDGDVAALRLTNVLGAAEKDGTLAQFIVLDDNFLVRAPKNLSFEEASTLSCAGGTATNILTSIPIEKGTTVVTQGTGGVSCFVIQFAAAMGARVIATSSTNEKLQKAKQLGASELINYKATPNWADEVLELTGGKGVDLVADVGGSGTLEKSIKALRQGGTTCVVGSLTAPTPIDILLPIITGVKTLRGILGCSIAMLEQTVKLIEEYDIHPVIGGVFEWEDAPNAFEKLRNQDCVGKIVIKV